MRKRVFIWAAVVLMMAAVSGFGQDVRYNFDKNTDFSKFKTYKWVPIEGANKVDDLVDKQIKSAIDAQLAAKGLSNVDSDKVDLFIGYQTAIGTEKQFTSYDMGGWGYGPGWGRGGWYAGQTSTIYSGQLAVDMYDTANKDLVWRGVVSKTLDPKAKPDKREKNLTKALNKLFKKYPPEKK
jgi:hypothetical protein